ncbi:MAG: Crp/Fnr family transcriptional regulator [Ardenticatenia bacterium]|nr:Crp/Fnr family transcriptional regulator [Ardenticatenia bacterium]
MATISPDVANVLKETDLFGDLSDDALEEVIGAARRLEFPGGLYIFHQGEQAVSFYVLVEGRVRLIQVTPDGNQVLVRFIMPGEPFAAVAIFGEGRYPVSAEVVDDAVVLCWHGACFADLMERHPKLALRAMGVLAGRVQEFQDRLREMATERVERRLAHTLLRLARQAGRRVHRGILIDLALSRQDLAEMSGTTLYTVSRTLRKWEQAGIVRVGRRWVVIRDPHALVSVADDLPPCSDAPAL